MFSRHHPVRPHLRAFGSRRGFSTVNTKEATESSTTNQQVHDAQPKEGAKSKGKFFEFIQKIDQLDRKVDTPAAATSTAANDYDLADIEISFDKVSRFSESKTGTEGAAETEKAAAVVGTEQTKHSKLTEEQLRKQAERDQLVHEAKRKYNFSFFKNFAFSGANQMELSQRSLEEYIINLESADDVQSLIISLVNSSYELNGLIPNVEMLFYRMFCSPLTTKEDRKGKDTENVLYGNIFAQKQVPLTYFGYKSLLETLVLDPKKKHLKKVIAHLSEFEPKDKVDPYLIDLIVKISIE